MEIINKQEFCEKLEKATGEAWNARALEDEIATDMEINAYCNARFHDHEAKLNGKLCLIETELVSEAVYDYDADGDIVQEFEEETRRIISLRIVESGKMIVSMKE